MRRRRILAAAAEVLAAAGWLAVCLAMLAVS